MDNKEQKFLGKLIKTDKVEKFIEMDVLEFGVANENGWMIQEGGLDAFFERCRKAKKDIPLCFQHDDTKVIGKIPIENFFIEGRKLKAKAIYVETRFFLDEVKPLLDAGVIQGSSPTVAPSVDGYNQKLGVWEISEGVLCEVSLVGLPAYIRNDIKSMSAKINSKKKNREDFELDILTF